jgi:hypothetical protein
MRTPVLGIVSSASVRAFIGEPFYEGRSALTVAPDEEVVVREYIIRRPAIAPRPVVIAPAPVPPVAVAPVLVPRAPVAYVRPGSIVPEDVDMSPMSTRPYRPIAAIPTLRRRRTRSSSSIRWSAGSCAYWIAADASHTNGAATRK